MVPIESNFFNDIQELISPKIYSFMTGVLLVDARQNNVDETILANITDYDRESGEYIDFYLPGYIKASDISEHKYKDRIINLDTEVIIGDEVYYFQPDLYNEAQKLYEEMCDVKKSRFPVLLLFDMQKKDDAFVIGDKVVIYLQKYVEGHDVTVTELFYKIFDYAYENTSMHGLKFRFKVLLGLHAGRIAQFIISQIPGLVVNLITANPH